MLHLLTRYSLSCRLHNLILIMHQFDSVLHFDWCLSCISFSRSLGSHFYAILACVAGVWKEREKRFWAQGKREGCARREGGRETPARKPLFLQSRLLIMYAKITQLWMTSCQISLAAMRLFKSYFAYCFSFVFLKQEIWSEDTIKKRINTVVCWREKVATMLGLLYKIQHKSITFLLKVSCWTSQLSVCQRN